MSLGIVLTVYANLGTDPWNVFHVGLHIHLPLTLGQTMQSTSVFLIAVGWTMKIKPWIGTFIGITVTGLFVDLIMFSEIIKPPNTVLSSWVFLIMGITFLGAGKGMYISCDLGVGPRDAIILGIVNMTGKSVSLVKVILDLMVVIIGYFLGGPVGAGTIASAILVGPCMQNSLKYLKLPIKEVEKG